MIRHGVDILKKHGIEPKVFFAPSHTFDENTLIALRDESGIRIISDTVANDVYYENDFYFIPQQSGRVRKLPFKVCTFCYHPNMVKDVDFEELNAFLDSMNERFTTFSEIELTKRKKSMIDRTLRKIYFAKKAITT